MIRNTKLTFKKPALASSRHSSDPPPGKRSVLREQPAPLGTLQSELPVAAWSPVEEISDLSGPLWFLLDTPSGTPLYSLSFNERGTVHRVSVESGPLEPQSPWQVVVGQWMGGMASGNFCLKNAHGKYLSSDRFGCVSIAKEAAGSYELWVPELARDTKRVIFRRRDSENDQRNFYLALDPTLSVGLRADVETPADAAHFAIYCQTEYRRRAREELERKREVEAPSSDKSPSQSNPVYSVHYELDQMKRYMSWQDGRHRRPDFGPSARDGELLKSAKEGLLHSALLDRRAKMKSDKYCK